MVRKETVKQKQGEKREKREREICIELSKFKAHKGKGHVMKLSRDRRTTASEGVPAAC